MPPAQPDDRQRSLSVQSVCNQLARNGLVTADEVRTIYRRWQQEGGAVAADVSSFVKWLVTKKHLTDYQAAVVSGPIAKLFE